MMLASLAACDTGGLGASPDGVYAPGVGRGEDVDGLIVGHRLMEAGEFELALEAYIRAAGVQGLNVDTLSALGSANLRLGRLGQAEALMRQAVEEDPEFVPAWNNLGVILMERGKVAEAAEVFRRAFATDNGNSEQIRDNLALALAKLENPGYAPEQENAQFQLVRRGAGDFLIVTDL
ncbi:tetratricopeptide repeat protein [Ponticoccus sp. SC2-23]|nr:tetratricopeptide repeat protein [Ponticoccus sp. SC6-9]MBM1226590.1 tetratricopeptide repeat protein [Ponticoccus sp. SC6-15]MBM1230541.1 tetratricopeptide repeat protein [Ponticoccus sp. SC6-38]MBM1235064.1 tetratricopeptide repeat protein [Ponticoccus sp. SC6-45]MBM1239562.1 tetratricopeptide repeat protein [Ponticoccus sp. SC6-49]MBM1243344.1 tetratricopeptide repeat protein [Ponticoccus sp. SC2-64]MBM1248588.1 tetratricopeptide repeat protein [Ponticoccus sp. SC6-42]MBM1253173.1 tetr